MNILEIENYLTSASTKSVCVSRQILKEYPGFVRDIIICRDNRLKLEFNTYGYDEGGLYITFFFDSHSILIESVENFIGQSMANWNNISKSDWYPDQSESVDYDESGKQLKRDLFEKKILFPKGWSKYEIPVGYWKDVAEGIA